MLNRVIPNVYKTYLAVIKNSVASEMFKNFYAKAGPEEQDIMGEGKLSCAFYVSSILTIFDLISKIHGTVNGTIRDLEKSGWFKIDKPKIGSILIWEEQQSDDGKWHKHIGFYIGDNEAISNNSRLGRISRHPWTFNETRKVENVFWHKKLI